MKRAAQRVLMASLIGVMVFTGGCTKAARKARHLARANTSFASGDYERAELEYLSVLKFDRKNPEALQRLGILYYDQGSPQRALPYLREARDIQPGPEVQSRLARAYFILGGIKEARNEALTILQKYPGQEEAILVLAETSFTPTDIQDASQRLQILEQKAGPKVAFLLAGGTLAARQRDLKAAETAFKAAVKLDPKSAIAQVGLGELYWAQKDLKQAEACFRTGADLAPFRSPIRLRYVEFKLRTGDRAEAQRRLEAILKPAPDYLPALNLLARLSLEDRKTDAAATWIDKVLARDPGNRDARVLHARLLLAKNQSAKALVELEQLAKEYKRLAEVHYQLGLAYLLNNQLNKAAESLQQALTLTPDALEVATLLAQVNVRKGDAATAITSLKSLLTKHPTNETIYASLADAYLTQGDRANAQATFRRITELFPQNRRAPFMLGVTLRQQTNHVAARAAFEQARVVAPDDMNVLAQLVDLDLLDQKPVAALQRVQQEIPRQPQSAPLQMLLAGVYLVQKQTNQAEAALLKAVGFDPNYQPAYFQLAQLYVGSGQHQKALDQLEAILSKDPRNEVALMRKASLLELRKDAVKARTVYEQILAINPKNIMVLNNLAVLVAEDPRQLNQAYELVNRAHELAPKDPMVDDTLGWVLLKRREFGRALALFQESARRLPAEPEVLYHLGLAHYALGEEELARSALQRSLQLNKDFPLKEDARTRLAILSTTANPQEPGLLASFERKLVENPDDMILLNRLADLYERTGNYAKAQSTLARIVQVNPKAASALMRQAEIQATHLGNLPKALELAKAARSLRPLDPHAALLLGRLQYRSGDFKWAHSLLVESAGAFSQEPEVLYDLALAQYSVGRLEDARKSAQTALGLGKPFTRAEAAKRWLALVIAYQTGADLPQAEAQAAAVLKQNPADVAALMVTALVQEKSGNLAGALPVYEKVYAGNPLFVPVIRALAVIYAAQTGDNAKAYAVAQKAREAFPRDAEVAKAFGITNYRRGEFSYAVRLLKESAATRANDADVFYYLGQSSAKIKDKAGAKSALNQALTLNPNHTLAADAKRVLAELK